jgi:hypothetical protein
VCFKVCASHVVVHNLIKEFFFSYITDDLDKIICMRILLHLENNL